MMEFNTTTINFFEIQPYFFFYVIGIVFASSLFILLLLKFNFNISRYTKIYFLSVIGLLAGAKLFGILTGLFNAIVNNEKITLNTFLHTGIVFYGGLIGFILSYLLICKLWNKYIEYRVIDIVAVCIPMFHFWGRLSCFFSGCCYGKENYSNISVLYTNRINNEIVTLPRVPIQLIEAGCNLFIMTFLMILLFKRKYEKRILIIYICMYAILRIILELFRGDISRGIWNGISFSQFVSAAILIIIASLIIRIKYKEKIHEIY